jgi:peptidoglycan endopeptidase LytE
MAKPMLRPLVLLVLVLSTAACASTGHIPQPFPRPGESPAEPTPAAGLPAPAPADAYGITGTALGLRGTPYRNGGTDPSGFDCSGFVWYVFAQHGVRVPRTVGELAHVGTSVNGRGVEPGDLVFFDTSGSGPSHVGIALGGDEFIHAPSSNGEVRVERLSAGYWAARFIGARRVL